MARPFLPVLALALFLSPASTFAQRLPTTVVPTHYDLAFDVDLAQARFTGTTRIQVQVTQPVRRIVLHALELDLTEVEVAAAGRTHRATVTPQPTTETVALTLPLEIPAGPAEIRARYGARLNDDLRGFYLSTANNRRYAVTQFESTDARRAFPSFDEPAFKATFAVTLTIDAADTAISNGRLLADVPGPGPGRHTLTFDRTAKMSSYLVAMAVGDFTCTSGGADGTPIRICATPGKEPLHQVALDAAQQILPYFNRYYSQRYPFGKLDVVAIPDFAAGAMENTGAIFYRETDLLADPATTSVQSLKRIWTVLAHEMAHQWFGDLVTMQWWNDLWLNEGFATWMESRPLAALKPEWNIPVDEAAATQYAMGIDALGATRPIRNNVETPKDIEGSFDAIAYEKSAAVLRMIEGWVGEDAFRAGVNAYLERHAYANATAEDFWAAMTRASGKPVDEVLAAFVTRPGLPLVTVSGDCGAGSGAGLQVRQDRFLLAPQRSTPTRGAWHLPLCERPTGSDAVSCTLLATPTAPLACPSAGVPYLNAGARGYYRTAYGAPLLRALAADVQRLSAPERLSLLGDEWALVRAGTHTAADYLTLASGFARESSAGVLDEVTGRLGAIRQRMVTAQTRPAFERFVRTLLRPALEAIGFDTRPSDTADVLERRATLIGTLGTAGADPDVATRARAALDAALEGRGTLEPTAAGAIVGVAAARGDVALWEALDRAARQAASPLDHERYLFALARFADPALIDRGLQLALGDRVRSQDTARYLAAFLRNPEATARTWAFIKEHWSALEPRVTVYGGDVNLAAGLSAFCDASARRDIRAFFTTHRLPAAARALEQTYETIGTCIAMREKQTPAVTAWLKERDAGSRD
jgi:aminopeptidase N